MAKKRPPSAREIRAREARRLTVSIERQIRHANAFLREARESLAALRENLAKLDVTEATENGLVSSHE